MASVRLLFHKSLTWQDGCAAYLGAQKILSRFGVLVESGWSDTLGGLRDAKKLEKLLGITEKGYAFILSGKNGPRIFQHFGNLLPRRNVLGIAVVPYEVGGYQGGSAIGNLRSEGIYLDVSAHYLDVFAHATYVRSGMVSTYHFWNSPSQELDNRDRLNGISLMVAAALGELLIPPKQGNDGGEAVFPMCNARGCLMATDSRPGNWLERFVTESTGFCKECFGAIGETISALKKGRI
jgi:hypothetical protein